MTITSNHTDAEAMDYTLHARALIDIKRKDKAAAHASRLFRHIPVVNVGRYWKGAEQWEFRVAHDCEFADDKTALWETLQFFHGVLRNWQITVGPNNERYELLIAAVGECHDGQGLTWCSFELWRGLGHFDLAAMTAAGK